MGGVQQVTYTHFPPLATPDQALYFSKNIPLGSWPADGSGPAQYPNSRTYPDGTGKKYFPSKVLSAHDGLLDFFLDGPNGAVFLPFGYQGFTEGTFDVRLKVDSTFSPQANHFLGIWWPLTNYWTNEIDYPESDTGDYFKYSKFPYMAVLQTTYLSGTTRFKPDNTPRTPQDWYSWHNYTLDWRSGWVRSYQDGVLVSEVLSPPDHVPDERMRWGLQAEYWNSGEVAPAPGNGGHILVDSVRYWK